MSACSRASLGAPRASSRAPSRAFRARVPRGAARRPLPRRAVSGDNASGVGASDARFDVDGLPDDFSDADPRAPGAPPPPSPSYDQRRPQQAYQPPLTGGGPLVTLTRGQLARKDVVTRTSGVRLGVVTQLWVDVDDWEVVALDVRPGNSPLDAIGGAVDHVLMSSLRQVGDVVLVHDESAVERRWSSYGLSTVVGCDVVTERGVYIGRVRDYEFDPEDGLVQRLVVDALGLPVVPEGVVSTYAVDVSEILSAGLDRVIVADGAESRVEQLTASLLQRLQLTAPPWEEDLATYADYYEQDERRREMDARARFEAAGRREDPCARERDYYESERRRRQGSRDYYEREREPARTSGIPLVRPNRPYERRDADGGYGDAPSARPRFEDWTEPDPRRKEYEYEYEYETMDAGSGGAYGYARAGGGGRGGAVSSPPPPPPEAWGRAPAPPPRVDSNPRRGGGGGEGEDDVASRWNEAGGGGRGFDASEDML